MGCRKVVSVHAGSADMLYMMVWEVRRASNGGRADWKCGMYGQTMHFSLVVSTWVHIYKYSMWNMPNPTPLESELDGTVVERLLCRLRREVPQRLNFAANTICIYVARSDIVLETIPLTTPPAWRPTRWARPRHLCLPTGARSALMIHEEPWWGVELGTHTPSAEIIQTHMQLLISP